MSAQLLAVEPVPNTLEEAFALLDRTLAVTDRKSFKQQSEHKAVTSAHRGLGMYIRNQWFRAGRSPIPTQLRAQHLDDASSIVLTSYWRYLNGKPLEIERQISCYERWWQEQRRLMDAAKAKGESSYETPLFSCPEG
jgi:hypothetical protein